MHNSLFSLKQFSFYNFDLKRKFTHSNNSFNSDFPFNSNSILSLTSSPCISASTDLNISDNYISYCESDYPPRLFLSETQHFAPNPSSKPILNSSSTATTFDSNTKALNSNIINSSSLTQTSQSNNEPFIVFDEYANLLYPADIPVDLPNNLISSIISSLREISKITLEDEYLLRFTISFENIDYLIFIKPFNDQFNSQTQQQQQTQSKLKNSQNQNILKQSEEQQLVIYVWKK